MVEGVKGKAWFSPGSWGGILFARLFPLQARRRRAAVKQRHHQAHPNAVAWEEPLLRPLGANLPQERAACCL